MKLLFFGVLTDVTGQKEVELSNMKDLDAVERYMKEKYPDILTYSYVVSVNKVIVRENITLKEYDEVAFLPPFAGG